jgi:hypothetical protein
VVSLSDTACTWDTPGVTGTFEFTVN